MRHFWLALLLAVAGGAQTARPKLPDRDAIRLREFFRLCSQLQDEVWPQWSSAPAPVLLVTPETEFLTHHPDPPKEFTKLGEDLYARPRQFPTALLATFPAFGPPSVIVIGEPENTEAKSSTPWLFTLMHEHFHQLQDGQPGFYQAVEELGLSRGDKSGMWMLNYPFPYENREIGTSFAKLRDLLLEALAQPDGERFQALVKQYRGERRRFFAQLTGDDRKYLSLQLWKEGIARYVQVRCAEAAGGYVATREYAVLPDYESFESHARRARADTLNELKKADLAEWKRVVVYSFGAAEGLLLDRINPHWKGAYFKNLFTLDPYFEK